MNKINVGLISLVIITGCSGTVPELGLSNNQLKECPESPNCVSSQAKDNVHFIKPLIFDGSPEQVKINLLKVISDRGDTKVTNSEDNYIRVEFVSSLLKFVDDVEFYFPEVLDARTVIHVRSASRIGHSDFDVNRKRIEAIRIQLNTIK